MIGERHLEVWSPLRWINVRFFVSDEGAWVIKVGNGRRKPLPTIISALRALRRWPWRERL